MKRDAQPGQLNHRQVVGSIPHCDDLITIPDCQDFIAPIPVVIAEQLLAYHVARLRGCPIDQPRNLAKSVTVE